MKIKKRYISSGIVITLLLLLVGFYLFLIPRDEIKSLATGYVQKKINARKKANYKIVNKRPYTWTPLKKVNKKAYQAIIISEDASFYQHDGIDLGQIKEAVKEKMDGKRLRGASTISQQVVKNLFLSPDKKIWRKLKEMGFSVYLEKNVEKDKILELYLNIIEYGPGIYGIDAASEHYFQKRPEDLTAKEGAFLAMLLPNPKRHRESFKKGKLTPYAKKTMGRIISKMKKAKFLKPEEADTAMEIPFSWEEKVDESFTDNLSDDFYEQETLDAMDRAEQEGDAERRDKDGNLVRGVPGSGMPGGEGTAATRGGVPPGGGVGSGARPGGIRGGVPGKAGARKVKIGPDGSIQSASYDDYETMSQGDDFDPKKYKTMHEKARAKLESEKRRKARLAKKYRNGGKFKKRFRDDIDIEIRDDPDYDPDALIEDQSGFEAEFKVD